MRIGIMGGTLDPVHCGHMDMAQAARSELKLDSVMLLPSGDPPHKTRESNRYDRLEMARLAAETAEDFYASDIEIAREGITYTVDTLTELQARQPGDEWVYIIGADTVGALDSWRDFPRVAKLCSFAAIGRPGYSEDEIRRRAEALYAAFGARIYFVNFTGPDISSTQIRNRVAEGLEIAGLVPDGVAQYIRAQGLYLCAYTEAEILERLRTRLTLHRYFHTLGVADTAQQLAARYGVDPMRARLAGLLHDCAKSMPDQEMARLVKARVADADEAELALAHVLHAPAGMLVAQDEFGVRDPAILSAIRRHTLGGKDMTAFDALIYVSDFIEPNRRPFPGLEEARTLAQADIFAAARACARLTRGFIERKGGTLNPRTAEMLKTGGFQNG